MISDVSGSAFVYTAPAQGSRAMHDTAPLLFASSAVVSPPRKPSLRKKEASVKEKFAAKEAAWKRRPDLLQNHHRIYHGDARVMAPLTGRDQVDLVITSPPYW